MRLAGIILLSIGGGVVVLLCIVCFINVIWDYELFETDNINGKKNGSILGTILFVGMLIFVIGMILLIIGCGEINQ